MYQIIKQLHESQLYEDVKHMTNDTEIFKTFTNEEEYEVNMWRGDAHYYFREYKEAIRMYNRALKVLKDSKDSKPKKKLEYELKYKNFLCFKSLNMMEEAAAQLSEVPANHKSLNLLLISAQLEKDKKVAINYFTKILMKQPYCLAAIRGLLKVNFSAKEIITLIKDKLEDKFTINWMETWLKAEGLSQKGKYKEAVETMETIDSLSTNTDLLATTAEMCFLMGNYYKSKEYFKKVRDIDQGYHYKMEMYAYLLHYQCSNNPALEELAVKCSTFPPNSAAFFIINGFYYLNNSKIDESYYFAIKSLKLDPGNIDGLLLKGMNSVAKGDHQEALVLFQEAIQLAPHRYEPYYYTIEINIKREKISLSLAFASKLKHISPSARSYALSGALVYKLENAKSAKPLLEKALSLDNRNLEAILMMSKIIKSLSGVKEAIKFLEKNQPQYPSPFYFRLLFLYRFTPTDQVKALDHAVAIKRLEELKAARILYKDVSNVFINIILDGENINDPDISQIGMLNNLNEIFDFNRPNNNSSFNIS